ncbi:MAG: Fe-S cluster assembly ATPase SufC [Waddliaceae bacterium]|jgi:Fe-S cluster assembly ATP-binding protein|nr:Fe-S cluster assembly ATPase SufC [Waddliaceae bacterium]MBT3579345.1 Fe-S cluster assembly ATPase SufC [Waddliaceae bacterium]MBT4444835.1 Fe-S cluster assembly ATPase SufC [Waddliaceae bacterium]MBT6928029.1 Fe-S cluster assembly ATPase SufC [Waddliaceae bacterium]MBT7264295.1 Fe-S cluster assembly ATPase SufC [Waddliaceae bacterium]
MFEIRNLHVAVDGKEIIKGFTLKIQKGEIHVIMGPNGTGKSTLAKAIAGHPAYEILDGEVLFDRKNILDLSIEERVHCGIFMGFQYPVEVPGVTNELFLRTSYNSICKTQGKKVLSQEDFSEYLSATMKAMEIRSEFKERNVNEGFSGGEKKRNEILQMAILDPKVAILDETDSGLDIDALRIVASGVNRVMSSEKCLLLITHYQRLLDYITPDYVHIMMDGKIVQSGTAGLACELEKKGYGKLFESEGEGK